MGVLAIFFVCSGTILFVVWYTWWIGTIYFVESSSPGVKLVVVLKLKMEGRQFSNGQIESKNAFICVDQVR